MDPYATIPANEATMLLPYYETPSVINQLPLAELHAAKPADAKEIDRRQKLYDMNACFLANCPPGITTTSKSHKKIIESRQNTIDYYQKFPEASFSSRLHQRRELRHFLKNPFEAHYLYGITPDSPALVLFKKRMYHKAYYTYKCPSQIDDVENFPVDKRSNPGYETRFQGEYRAYLDTYYPDPLTYPLDVEVFVEKILGRSEWKTYMEVTMFHSCESFAIKTLSEACKENTEVSDPRRLYKAMNARIREFLWNDFKYRLFNTQFGAGVKPEWAMKWAMEHGYYCVCDILWQFVQDDTQTHKDIFSTDREEFDDLARTVHICRDDHSENKRFHIEIIRSIVK